MKILLSFIFATFLFLGVFTSANAQIVFTNAENNSILTLPAGAKQEVLFKLRQNGGTNYAWTLTQHKEDICHLVKEESTPEAPVREGMVGTPIIRYFYFKSTGKAGTSHIQIKLQTPTGEVAEVYNFTIKTEAAKKPSTHKK